MIVVKWSHCKKCSLALLGMLISACSAVSIEDYEGGSPDLDLFDYFSGSTVAWGMFEDRFGKVRRQFKVAVEGKVDGDTLILTEDFVYNDGETEQRVWVITDEGSARFRGRADGVVGVANGEVRGNVLQWRYDFDLRVADSTWRVRFNDWMYLQPDGVLINRAVVSKWGITLGEVTITFVKPSG